MVGERGNAIETYIRQDGNGCAPEESRVRESLWIVERTRKEHWVIVWVPKYVAGRRNEYDYDDRAHGCGHTRVYPCGRLDAADIQ